MKRKLTSAGLSPPLLAPVEAAIFQERVAQEYNLAKWKGSCWL